MMKKYAVILAGGSGTRAGGDVPKQFQLLEGVPVLWWSVRTFHAVDPDTRIHIVMHPGFFDLWDILFSELPEADRNIPVELVCGGRNRLESVANGIMAVPDDEPALIAVHDAARPLVTREVVRSGWETALANGTAVPAIPVTDSLRHLTGDGSESVPRSEFVAVQTPQVFDAALLKNAYSLPLNNTMTDDASVVEAAGHTVKLYPGSEYNIKITNPLDLEIAALLMRHLDKNQ